MSFKQDEYRKNNNIAQKKRRAKLRANGYVTRSYIIRKTVAKQIDRLKHEHNYDHAGEVITAVFSGEIDIVS